ncbi:hypothetical protein GPJ56_000499 [Histomonas meleagridis]|uniref:uncharacterized protein n=1 Tax=Histomonas meleagridis TaxID=135588 RepID=UPI00355A8B72|nr:hypothetical protein GPJ56_000499 [Histomonas meleagridis]KAH0796461.1 hypothetical protein GO595_010354 [Histomonas meleagridis]
MNKTLIKVNNDKLNMMKSKCWCNLEIPIIAIPVDYQLKHDDPFTSGCIMLTKGAFYIFKTKVFGKLEYISKFSYLSIKTLIVKSDLLSVELNEVASFKTSDAVKVAKTILKILDKATFGIRDIHICKIKAHVPFPASKVSKRPKSALKYRALLLAHFYNIKGEQLYSIDYLDKWENDKKPYITIGPSLHPGNFAAAIGHAIAWEPLINSIILKSFAPTKFSKFLHALLENSIKITSISFNDYNDQCTLKFDLEVKKTTIRDWYFIKCTDRILLNFAENTKKLPAGISSINFRKCILKSGSFNSFVTFLTESTPACQITQIEMKETVIPDIEIFDISRLLCSAKNLECLSFDGMSIDASIIVDIVCNLQIQIKILKLKNMKFSNAISAKKTFHDSIVFIDISKSSFSNEAFSSFFKLVTSSGLKVPITLRANNLSISNDAYESLTGIDHNTCKCSLLELEWNGNSFPKGSSKLFFDLLFTQKKLRFLSLVSINTECEDEFLQSVVWFGKSLPLIGLDINGSFNPNFFVNFINEASNFTGLRRLGLKNSRSGDKGLEELSELAKKLPDLNEITADGFEPSSPQPFLSFWTTISNHPGIRSCDLPGRDLKKLGLDLNALDQNSFKAMSLIQGKPRPTTTLQRVGYLLNQVRDGREPEISGDIFSLAASMDWILPNGKQTIDE